MYIIGGRKEGRENRDTDGGRVFLDSTEQNRIGLSIPRYVRSKRQQHQQQHHHHHLLRSAVVGYRSIIANTALLPTKEEKKKRDEPQNHQPFPLLQSLLVAPIKSSTFNISAPSLVSTCQT